MNEDVSLNELERIVSEASIRANQLSAERSELVVDEKSAGQFVSSADIEIEGQIRNDLQKSFGEAPMIGEEMGGLLSSDSTGWAIDPIDGTSNFLLGLPMWGISVGLIEGGRSTMGVIALPSLGLMISATEGSGLRINRFCMSSIARLPSVKVIALGENDFEKGSETDLRAEAFRHQGYAVVRYRCAVFSLASAAMGRLSGYIENGCGLWDIAAAAVICREAGMQVQTAEVATGRYLIDARWATDDPFAEPQN